MAISSTIDDFKSSERFRVLVDAVVDYGIFMLDPQGTVVTWNAGAQSIKGYSAEEAIGRHFSMFYTKEARDVQWPQRELAQAAKAGRLEDEGWRVRKDGSRFWANVVISALRESDGRLVGFVKVTRDLTERRAQEEALRESEQKLRLMIEGVRDYAIFMLSPLGHIQSWNSGAQLLTGHAASEVIGSHFGMFYRAQDRDTGLPERELSIARDCERGEAEGRRVRKDGSIFWANVVLSAIRDANGVLQGYANVTRDITDRRKLQEMQNSSQRMNEFLAMLAHELRNPLAPIRNAVTILQLEPSPSPIVRSSRDMIDRQLSHMTRLVDDLLDVGRMNTGKIRLRKERVLYNQVLARAAEAVRPLMDARHHRFVFNVPATEIHMNADATRLAQVVQNLLTNAAKFTPAGGIVEMTVRIEASQVWTTVKDNGLGLSATAIDEIFELFAQGDAQSAAKESGLGIGLTLAKSLVEMHGGVLAAESAGPGQGSEFTFFIPDASIGGEADLSAANSPRLLIVDDNRDAADSLAEILRLMGCTVKVAYDGPTALAAAQQLLYAAALVDLGMPGMSGFEVVHGLRALPHGPQMLIAAVTGFGNDGDRQRTASAGFDIHFTKPVEFAALQSLVERTRQSQSGRADGA